jgi:predicted amidohydrolase
MGEMFPVPPSPEGTRALEEAGAELLGAMWTGFRHARLAYDADPSPDRWRTLKRARALYATAFACEHGGASVSMAPGDGVNL